MAATGASRSPCSIRGAWSKPGPSQRCSREPAAPLTRRLVARGPAAEGSGSPETSTKPLVCLELDGACAAGNPLALTPGYVAGSRPSDGVSLRLHEGETVGVVGLSAAVARAPSAGRAGLVPGRGGAVRLHGKNLRALRGRELRRAASGRSQNGVSGPTRLPSTRHWPWAKAVADRGCFDPCWPAGSEAAPWPRQGLEGGGGLEPAWNPSRTGCAAQLSGGPAAAGGDRPALVLSPRCCSVTRSVSMLECRSAGRGAGLAARLPGAAGAGMIFINHDLRWPALLPAGARARITQDR